MRREDDADPTDPTTSLPDRATTTKPEPTTVPPSTVVTSPTPAEVVAWTDLEPSQCFSARGFLDPQNTLLAAHPNAMSCDAPHDAEVFHTFDIEGGASTPYPGDLQTEDLALETCAAMFAAYVGVEYSVSGLDFGWLFPSGPSWDAGDRRVICYLIDPDLVQLTGSVAGSGR